MFSKKDSVATQPNKPDFIPSQEQKTALSMAIKHNLLKINAVAGSGKSSSLFYIAGEIVEPSIYLAYNRSMADEAKEKCESLGLHHVECRSTHSLAYRTKGVMVSNKLSRPRGRYRNVAGNGSEIYQYYGMTACVIEEGFVLTRGYAGQIVKDTVDKFEQSDYKNISNKNIPNHHFKDIEKRCKKGGFNKSKFTKYIMKYAEMLWEDRSDYESEVLATHNTYLKLFQLDNPDLSQYSVIYLDEAQDLNPVTYDIVIQNKDRCKIVLVGDEYQSIYQWNGAKNYLASLKCQGTVLSNSFRYGQEVADIANKILGGKVNIKGFDKIDTKVGDNSSNVIDYDKPYTILYRSNMTLLLDAIDLVAKGKDVNINMDVRDFIKMLTSCEALWQGDMKKVKHESIIPFETWFDLVEEAKVNGEVKRLCNIVESGEVEKVVNTLTHYKASNKSHIQLITAHRSKGATIDQVVLADDFPSNYNRKGQWVGLTDEERNLLYVATTRAVKALQYNQPVVEILEKTKYDEAPKLKVGSVSVHKIDEDVLEGLFKEDYISQGLKGEQANNALNEVIDMENLRDSYVNGEMSLEDAYDHGFINELGQETEGMEAAWERNGSLSYEGINQELKNEMLKLDSLTKS